MIYFYILPVFTIFLVPVLVLKIRSAILNLFSWKYLIRSVKYIICLTAIYLQIYSYLSSSRASPASRTTWTTSVFQKAWVDTSPFYLKRNQTWLKVRHKKAGQGNELLFIHPNMKEIFYCFAVHILRSIQC